MEPVLGSWAKVLQLSLLIIVVGLVAAGLVVTLHVAAGEARSLLERISEGFQADPAGSDR